MSVSSKYRGPINPINPPPDGEARISIYGYVQVIAGKRIISSIVSPRRILDGHGSFCKAPAYGVGSRCCLYTVQQAMTQADAE